MKTIGIVPVRMAASRFPGKPLYPIHGKTMLEHVYQRAILYEGWDHLVIATCDQEIEQFSNNLGYPVVMTGSHHTRALDRVAEAYKNLDIAMSEQDVVVCIQGDEPMMHPDMINTVVNPMLEDTSIPAMVLAMHIIDESIWQNPDTVKIIHNTEGEVLYTSRAPIPYAKKGFTPDLMARRIYGIFSFRWKELKAFTMHPETRLEQLEACDSNRILDMPFRQRIAPYPYVPSFSVDSPSDIKLVEQNMLSDKYWHLYK